MNSDFYKNYYDEYFRLIYSDDLDETFDDFKKLAESVKSNKHKLISVSYTHLTLPTT